MASVKMTVTEEEFNTLLMSLSRTTRANRSDAEMWAKLANDPELPKAARNAEVCTEEADKADALYNELIGIKARQDAR